MTRSNVTKNGIGAWMMIPAAACMLAVWVGCNDRDPGTPTGIGPDGGTLHQNNGAITLEIPKGALSKHVDISIHVLGDDALPKGGLPGTLVDLKPDGLAFDKPVTLSLSYGGDEDAQGSGDWLRVVQVHDDGSLTPTHLLRRDAEQRVVTARLRHFSRYALANMEVADALVETAITPVDDVDLLFVVDNSGSMKDEQENLGDNFPRLIAVLEEASLNYRVGVISSDLGAGPNNRGRWPCDTVDGDDGRLRYPHAAEDCPTLDNPWIERIHGVSNVPGAAVKKAFSCMARLGNEGCGFEQPLEATYRALVQRPTRDAGFLRDDAALALVYLTDEDDCSATPPYELFEWRDDGMDSTLGPWKSFRCFEFGLTCDDVVDPRGEGSRENCRVNDSPLLHGLDRYSRAFRRLKAPGHLVVSAIAGAVAPVSVEAVHGAVTLAPTCGGNDDSEHDPEDDPPLEHVGATPPIRLATFVEAFGAQGSMHSICEDDFTPALENIADLVVRQTKLSWCLPYQPVDTDPETAALDADCFVVSAQGASLPMCGDDTDDGCFTVDEKGCGADGVSIRLHRVDPDQLGDELFAICLALA